MKFMMLHILILVGTYHIQLKVSDVDSLCSRGVVASSSCERLLDDLDPSSFSDCWCDASVQVDFPALSYVDVHVFIVMVSIYQLKQKHAVYPQLTVAEYDRRIRCVNNGYIPIMPSVHYAIASYLRDHHISVMTWNRFAQKIKILEKNTQEIGQLMGTIQISRCGSSTFETVREAPLAITRAASLAIVDEESFE